MSKVIRPAGILHILGVLTLAVGLAMMLPMLTALWYDDGSDKALGISMAIMVGIGALLRFFFKPPDPEDGLSNREGMLTVALCWICMSLGGALPYIIGGWLSLADAVFESTSGFTTTGASVIPDIQAMPGGLLMWRSFTQWLGGIGIIILYLSILPTLGVGGMQLFKAEIPGPSKNKLTPRLRDTAAVLWRIYLMLSAALLILLLLGGMSLFEAVTHTFTTISTAGFSTRNNSLASFDDAYIQWVVVIFMYVSGASFALHNRFLSGDRAAYKSNSEFKIYSAILLFGAALLTWILLHNKQYATVAETVRHAFFQITCIVTTTGFSSTDYETWPSAGRAVLMSFYFVGGCVGSTSGGLKILRIILLARVAWQEVLHLLHPRSINVIKIDGKAVPPEVLNAVISFFVIFVLLIAASTVALAAMGAEVEAAFWASAACLANVGAAFASLGPVENFGHLPDGGKWLLSLAMLMGRLEIYTIMIIFVPAFWRR